MRYLGFEDTERSYDFSQPWDSEKNLRPAQRSCAQWPYSWDERHHDSPVTGFVAVTGEGTAWPPTGTANLQRISLEVPQLIVLVHLWPSDIHWMEPRDLDCDEFLKSVPKSGSTQPSEKCQAVLFADGEIWSLREECPLQILAKFFTIEEAKLHDREAVLGPYRE